MSMIKLLEMAVETPLDQDLSIPETLAMVSRKVMGKVLRDKRRERGLTQEEAAKLLGRSRASLYRTESGDRRVPVSDLPAFALAYGCTAAWFLEETQRRLDERTR